MNFPHQSSIFFHYLLYMHTSVTKNFPQPFVPFSLPILWHTVLLERSTFIHDLSLTYCCLKHTVGTESCPEQSVTTSFYVYS